MWEEATTYVSFICFVTLEKWKTCLKNMLPRVVPRHDLNMMRWIFEEVWIMSSYALFIYRTITYGVSWFVERNRNVFKGNRYFHGPFNLNNFLRSSYPLEYTISKFHIFSGSFTIFSLFVNFFRHLLLIIQVRTFCTWKCVQKGPENS